MTRACASDNNPSAFAAATVGKIGSRTSPARVQPGAKSRAASTRRLASLGAMFDNPRR